MMPNVKMWEKEKIESLFPMEIASCIINIPLFDMIEEDKLVWYNDIHGQYNVKSGYNMMITSTGRGEEGTTQEDWNCIWKVHDPPKAKHLLWRICKGCLPTRNRLKDRCVLCPLVCPICDCYNEDEMHIIFSCLVSTQARQSAGLDHVVTSWIQHVGTAKELLLTICQAESREVAGKLAMLLWVLWKNRNNSVWEDIKESGQVLGAKAMHLWQEWKAVQCTTSNKNTQPELQQQHTQWQRPQFGWFKCNVDAGFHNDSCKTSGGRL
ncbi:unnamed protein product [Trifolium pratense]|uniref:Uncharacterized protein n=1 Tax=Trifolium pratense TaxID=57577 RepID=A0ACB0LET3_TRIPR|nr:unnamed protein product [Trifolium pratense]